MAKLFEIEPDFARIMDDSLKCRIPKKATIRQSLRPILVLVQTGKCLRVFTF